MRHSSDSWYELVADADSPVIGGRELTDWNYTILLCERYDCAHGVHDIQPRQFFVKLVCYHLSLKTLWEATLCTFANIVARVRRDCFTRTLTLICVCVDVKVLLQRIFCIAVY
jgi:hypothetical protein